MISLFILHFLDTGMINERFGIDIYLKNDPLCLLAQGIFEMSEAVLPGAAPYVYWSRITILISVPVFSLLVMEKENLWSNISWKRL